MMLGKRVLRMIERKDLSCDLYNINMDQRRLLDGARSADAERL